MSKNIVILKAGANRLTKRLSIKKYIQREEL